MSKLTGTGSAEMSLIEMYISSEEARDVVHRIGELNVVQFRDLNVGVNEFQRSFVSEVKKLDDILRQYSFFESQLSKKGISLANYPYEAEPVQVSEIDEFSENATLIEARLQQLNDALDVLQSKRKELIQFRYSLLAVENFFSSNVSQISDVDHIYVDNPDESGRSKMPFICGTINREKVGVLQQILWRVLRGNLLYYSEEVPELVYDPKKGESIAKNSFIIFAHGSLINEKIKRIAESLDANLYEVLLQSVARQGQLLKINGELNDLTTVIQQTDGALISELVVVSKDLPRWTEIISKEKAVYKVMNLCNYDDSRLTLVAEGWIPTSEIEHLKNTVKSLTVSESIPTIVNILSTSKTPPTFHRTNKFTVGFQTLCDTYGIASYREINPGLPTIITFPFMFAIMFGDLGHGFLMFLAAAVLVYYESKIQTLKRDEIFDMAFSGRYIILMMGAFSMYTGLLYNDIFSKSLTLFQSGWQWPVKWQEGETIVAKQTGVYVFGLDSIWHGAENALLFSNSYKMKLSVLMGYLHMTYSYFFALTNYIYFGSVIDIVGNFIPGLLFMQSIFGYLSVCIVFKWCVDWFKIEQQPPGLLNMLITMFLSPGLVTEPLYGGQSHTQIFLLILALICVPWLVLVKPLYLKRKIDQESAQQEYEALIGEQDNDDSNELNDDQDQVESEEAHNFGDIMIHQVIHTIEFCLNCVSHTASYLRLWALSLAHAQLSSVLWTMTIKNAFGMTGIVGIVMTVCLFAMWFFLTIAILVVMEGTSAMLHSLRLHWVESMSKYFEGEGVLYEPFGFSRELF